MVDGYLLGLRAFREVEDCKAQALKLLEEAAEAFGAWQQRDAYRGCAAGPCRDELRRDLIDECLDTVQATVNLLAAVGATQGEVDASIARLDARTCCRTRLQDDFVTAMDENDAPGIQDMSYRPVCGAEFAQHGE